MEYLLIPKEIEKDKLKDRDYIFAPSSLTYFHMKNKYAKPLHSLLSAKDKGKEIGSFAYIPKSNKFFIRTKAINRNSWIPYLKGEEAIIPMNPLLFMSYNLKKGDILLAKDSNIGESIYIDNDKYNQDYMISGGIIRLRIKQDSFYVFAFIKSKFFKEQLNSLVPRGATIRHSKDLYLNCLIPFPNEEHIKNKVESITQEIITNENKIIEKYYEIIKIVNNEIRVNQKSNKFHYKYPNLEEIKNTYRLDASIYSKRYDEMIFLVKNYKGGYSDLSSLGFKSKRGSSLEIKGLGTRLNSDKPKKGFSAIITPTEITEYGTIDEILYIGTKKKLVKIDKGDIIFGGEATRRLFVNCDETENMVTNYHGIKIYNTELPLSDSIFIWAFLSYWKEEGILDDIAVGGQGGHLAPEYFNYLLIPNFPNKIKLQIAELYYGSNEKNLGIYKLDKKNKELKIEIEELIHQIVLGII